MARRGDEISNKVDADVYLRRRRTPSGGQLLACSRICLSEILERQNETYVGEGKAEDLLRCINDLVVQLDRWFVRHGRGHWAERRKIMKYRTRWRHPYLIAAYNWRKKKVASYTPRPNAVAATIPRRPGMNPAPSAGNGGVLTETEASPSQSAR